MFAMKESFQSKGTTVSLVRTIKPFLSNKIASREKLTLSE